MCPWALEIHRTKNGGGHLHGEALCTNNAYTHTNHRIIKLKMGGGGGGALTRRSQLYVKRKNTRTVG